MQYSRRQLHPDGVWRTNSRPLRNGGRLKFSTTRKNAHEPAANFRTIDGAGGENNFTAT